METSLYRCHNFTARSPTESQSNTLDNHQATDPTSINRASISEKRQELMRILTLRKSSSFKVQLLDLPASRCLGCLDWNDMTNEKLQLGLLSINSLRRVLIALPPISDWYLAFFTL